MVNKKINNVAFYLVCAKYSFYVVSIVIKMHVQAMIID